MGYFENLILQRVYFFIGEIEETLSEYLKTSLLINIDIEQCIYDEQLFLTIELRDDFVLVVKEEYSFEHHKLKIEYNYTLLSSNYKPIVSFDNSPHHPRLTTFPHHKHYYPKSRYKPVNFTGEFIDALQEIYWIVENKK